MNRNQWIKAEKSREYIHNGYFLVFCKNSVFRYALARWDTGHGWRDVLNRNLYDVTHFMPLPDSPEDEP